MRILYLHREGRNPPTIAKILREEGMKASRKGIANFIKRYKETDTIARRPGSGRPSKVTQEVKTIVEEQMRTDDETTAYQLHTLLESKGYKLSLRTILRCRTTLGWTFRGSSYCQLIRDANKQKRLEWAREYVGEAENGFQNVIWTDETSVQLETHRRFCCRKVGERPRNKPRCDSVCVYIKCIHVHTCRYIYEKLLWGALCKKDIQSFFCYVWNSLPSDIRKSCTLYMYLIIVSYMYSS